MYRLCLANDADTSNVMLFILLPSQNYINDDNVTVYGVITCIIYRLLQNPINTTPYKTEESFYQIASEIALFQLQ